MLNRPKKVPEWYQNVNNRELRGKKWFWCDKKLTKFFRDNFDKKHYMNLRSIYLALCEMDSDFARESAIYGFKSTLQTYSGRSADIVTKYFYFLEQLELVSVYQVRDEKGHFGRSYLYMSDCTNQLDLYAADKEWYDAVLNDEDFKLGRGYNMLKMTTDPAPLTSFPVNRDSGEPLLPSLYNNCVNNEEISDNEELKTVCKENKASEIIQPSINESIKNTVSKRNECFVERAERLAKIVSSHTKIRKDASTNTWYTHIEKLFRLDKVALKRIDTVLDWYETNIGGEYVPQAFSAQTFREKFPNLEQALARMQNKRNTRRWEPIAKSDPEAPYEGTVDKTDSMCCQSDDDIDVYIDIDYQKAIDMIVNKEDIPKFAKSWVTQIGIQEGLLQG